MSALRPVLLPSTMRGRLVLLGLLLLGLGLRLLVWRWHRLYPLGGDEGEYFNQALRWLQGEGYRDLPLMRPPLYPVFLAAVFQLFDSQVQRVRLVQAVISTAAVYLQWLFVRLALPPERAERPALIAAALVAGSFTLAANATELLTETTFVFGLLLVLCLLAAARRWRSIGLAVGAGIAVGTLALLRSVALPLVPLGVCGLLVAPSASPRLARRWLHVLRLAIPFALAAFAIVLPWTARNYAVYGHPILIDTTGAENLWLDNDSAGREAVKSALYALGEDRGARQSLSLERGIAAITGDPARFARKIIGPDGEARKLVALEYWDDLRARRAIWVPPTEVWLRLMLGDGIWLVLATLGVIGLWLLPSRALRWLGGVLVAYVVVTNVVFHVELRYRLPMYPLLACGAAVVLSGLAPRVRRVPLRALGAGATVTLFFVLLFLHRPYVDEGRMLVAKHWALWMGDGAAALRADPSSALARVQIAAERIARCETDGVACPDAEPPLRDAIAAVPDHPYAHLLLGALQRRRGDAAAARANLRYETASLEDLQRWMVRRYGPEPRERLPIGDGLDLGNVEGFHAAADGFRWTTARARLWLRRPEAAATLRLRMAHGRPPGVADHVPVEISAGGRMIATLDVGATWDVYEVALPPDLDRADGDTWRVLALSVDAPTFRPRDLDRADDDNRALGVMVEWAEIVPAPKAEGTQP